MSSEKSQLISIQYLRAFAALMIVLHHARNPKEWLFNPLDGYNVFAWGIDIFFVISGFIIYIAARNENYIDFLGRRIIRVIPLYWLATLSLLVINTNFHVWWINSGGFFHLLKSLFFIPHYSPSHPDRIWPYLIPGWTLNYEILFYLIFFLGLMVKRPLLVSTISIISLFLIGVLIEPENVVLKAYTKPILLEFLCGIYIAHAHAKGLLEKNYSWLIVIGVLVIFLLPFVNNKDQFIIGRILGSTMIITLAVSLGDRIPHYKLLHLLGDASYSIYLTHTVLSLGLSSKIWHRVPVEGWLQFGGWIVLTLLLSSVIGVIVHLYLEKPILKWVRSKWTKLLSN